MLLAALIVGALAAYYLGVRAGVLAAGVSAALFVAADIVPAVAVWAYLAVGAGVLGICALGPRFQKESHKQRVMSGVRAMAKRGLGWAARKR